MVRSEPTVANSPTATVVSARHIVPPKASVGMAEACGALDALMATPSGGREVLVREEGSLDDAPGSLRVGLENRILVNTAPELRPPYLPDPFARAALFLGLPGMAEAAVVPGRNRIPFSGAWPDRRGFRLEIAAVKEASAPRPPAFDSARRTLRVRVQESATVTVRLSSAMDAPDVQVMGLTQWVAAKSPESVPAFQLQALAGKHWMLTPYREIVLVHAVQRPVEAPTVPTLRAAKQAFGQTFATVDCAFGVHRRSTSKVELLSAWTDPVDRLADPAPDTVDRQAHLGKLDVVQPAPAKVSTDEGIKVVVPAPPPLDLSTLHEFGDSKHHRVSYFASATTSFRDYFSPDLTPTSRGRGWRSGWRGRWGPSPSSWTSPARPGRRRTSSMRCRPSSSPDHPSRSGRSSTP